MSTENAPAAEPVALEGPPPHLLIVRAPYYREVVERLTEGAARIVLRGPPRHDGFIALGCVVRGETDHYEHICREAMGGLMQVALAFGIPLGTGLLTVDRLEQALARASLSGPNKGAEAARAALLQIVAARRFGAAWRAAKADG
jgi:6,7-dimethyl-8-ribityllumazine synthase